MELIKNIDQKVNTIDTKPKPKKRKKKVTIPLDIQEKKFEEKTGKSFPSYYLKYQPKLIYFTTSLCKDSQAAEDVTTDAFQKALEEIDKYDNEKAQFSTWLFTIARNLSFQWIKEKKKTVSMDKEIDEDGASIKDFLKNSSEEDDQNNEMMTLNEMKSDIMKKAISELKQPYREVIELRELEGLQYKEIASRCGIGLSTLKSQIRNGRIILQNKVEKEFDILDEMYL